MWCAGARLLPPCLTDLGQLRRTAALLSKIGGANRPAGQLGERPARFASSELYPSRRRSSSCVLFSHDQRNTASSSGYGWHGPHAEFWTGQIGLGQPVGRTWGVVARYGGRLMITDGKGIMVDRTAPRPGWAALFMLVRLVGSGSWITIS